MDLRKFILSHVANYFSHRVPAKVQEYRKSPYNAEKK